MNFRPMREEDADAVRRVDMLAFTPQLTKIGTPRSATGEFPMRTRENILAAQAIFPQGCFVAEEGGELAGYIFARCWGTVGWIGVFGVHPAFQGKQVGQRLLAESISALQAAGCSTIGLETMPDSYYNLGFYMRLGFRPITLTASLQKALQTAPQHGGCQVRSINDEQGLAEVTRISRAAWSELDLRAEAVNAVQYGWGQALLIGDEEPYAAAVARTTNRRENLPGSLYEVTSLAALPAARPRLGELVQTLEGFAAGQGFDQLRLILNTVDWESLQVLLGRSYRIVHASLRLMLAGEYHTQAGLEFSRWGM